MHTVVVHIEVGVIALYGQVSVLVGDVGVAHIQEIDHLLQLAVAVLGAGNAPFGDIHLAQAGVVRFAAFPAPAGQAGVGVHLEYLFQSLALLLPGLGRFAGDYHAFGNLRVAGLDGIGLSLDDHGAQAALAARFKVGVIAEGGNVDAGLDGSFEYGAVTLHCNVLAVDSQVDLGHGQLTSARQRFRGQ